MREHIIRMFSQGSDWQTKSTFQRQGYKYVTVLVFMLSSQKQQNKYDRSFYILYWTLIDRCGFPIEEPNGGVKRSCETRGGLEAGLPVLKHTLHWAHPLTQLSITIPMATVQVGMEIYMNETFAYCTWCFICLCVTGFMCLVNLKTFEGKSVCLNTKNPFWACTRIIYLPNKNLFI